MENTPRENTEEPVLLSWEMPERTRKLFHATPFVDLAAAILILLVVVWQFYGVRIITWTATVMFLVYTLFVGRRWVVRPFWLAAAQLDVTENGVMITTVPGRVCPVTWADVRALKRGPYGFTVLSTPVVDISLPIPPDVRDRLIALLREASNARIIGFDSETT